MKAEQLSQTAAFIALKFYGLTKDEPFRSFFDEETIRFYERLVSELPKPLKSYHLILKKKWMRKFFIRSEELLLPGDLMHILMRKYYIERMINELKGTGIEQLLVLGAGFDHLAALHSRNGFICFELDMPCMARLKREFLDKYGYSNNFLEVIEAQFGKQNLSQIIGRTAGIDPDRETAVVAEGFFDYLDPDESSQILEDIGSGFRHPPVCISTVFSLDELSSLRSLVFSAGVRMVGEKLKLHQNLAEFISLFEDTGFIIERTISGEQMKKEKLDPEGVSLPVLPGFYLVRAKYKNS